MELINNFRPNFSFENDRSAEGSLTGSVSNEIFALWNIVQRILVGSYRSVGTTSRSLLQGSSCPVHAICLDNLMMGL
jgi:hypothetical protein